MQTDTVQPDLNPSPQVQPLPEFAKKYFPNICRLNWNELHEYLFARREMKTRANPPERRGSMDVVLAPRGMAKSSLVSLVFPIHAIVKQNDPYIIILSATERQAVTRLDNIRDALLENETLKEAFSGTLGKIKRSRANSLIVGKCRVDAFSAGSELRGLTHGEWRPTWIILDDVESSARALSSRYRDRLYEWMTEVIEHLGNGYTNIDVIGTLMHVEALPARLMLRPEVTGRLFRAIISEARNESLWKQWRAKFVNLDDPDRVLTARKFFLDRESEMMEGVRVLWPEKESYYELQSKRASQGEKSFNKEKQNQPPAQGGGLLDLTGVPTFRVCGSRIIVNSMNGHKPRPEIPLADLEIVGFLDPALGGRGGSKESGDFAAIATVGKDPRGHFYLLDGWIERATPSRQVEKIFELQAKWNYARFGVETNGFQRVLLDLIQEEGARRRKAGRTPWKINAQGISHDSSKASRIAMIEPCLRNGWMFMDGEIPKAFMDQIRDYPHGEHDDAPDAWASAIRMARNGATKSVGVIGSGRGREVF